MEQRNLLIAIVASVVILIGFQFVFERLYPPASPSAVTHATGSAKTAPAASPGSPPGTSPGEGQPAVAKAGAPALMTRTQAIAATPRVMIDTPLLHGSIALKGARINNLTLATYHETIDSKSPEVVLLAPAGTQKPYFAEFGWTASAPGTKLPGPDTVWKSAGGTLTPSHPVTLTWDNGAGLLFTRTISIDTGYMFTLHDSVRNTGKAPVGLSPYGLIDRIGNPPVSGYYILFEGLIGEFGGSLKEIKYTALTPGTPETFTSTDGWLGFTDKYWLTAIIPTQSAAIKARYLRTLDNGVDHYQTDFVGPTVTVAPGATGSAATRFFAGAKEVSLLDAYTATGIPNFWRSIDFGWFYFLTKPMFLTLQFFYRLLGNFGLAILALTLTVKILFFPLANKSYKAMSKMKLLQPEIKKLRERFPDDRTRQQQEMMALYKRVGANPLAGCLPIVIQIPVFYSLYKVLFVTIEMRHAPFFGWIHDLSAPDPTSFANLFGLIPFTPPHILMIGAWPLIMGISMFLQQRLNPQPVDPMQARMFMLLPIVFTYMLSSFPAGLVIYWAWNNSLSIAQQWVIMHRQGAA